MKDTWTKQKGVGSKEGWGGGEWGEENGDNPTLTTI